LPPPPPRSTLFPYTTLFRSRTRPAHAMLAAQMRARQPQLLAHEIGEGVADFHLFLVLLAVDRDRDVAFLTHAQALPTRAAAATRSEEHTSELQSLAYLVCRL